MTDTHIKDEDKPFYKKIVAASLEGIRYWRPGDVREAQHIIGSETYFDLLDHMTGPKICKLFYKAVVRKELPLVCLGKLTNGHLFYTNEV